MKRSYLILLFVLTLPFFIFADSETDFDVVKCYETAKSDDELSLCAKQDFEFSDKKLIQVYSDVLDIAKSKIMADTTLDTTAEADAASETLNRLVAAENAWIAYRDAQCQFEGTAMLGSPSEKIVITGCLSRLNKERVKMLGESIPTSESEENP